MNYGACLTALIIVAGGTRVILADEGPHALISYGGFRDLVYGSGRSVATDATEYREAAYMLEIRPTSLTLTAPLLVDISAPGTYSTDADLSPAYIPAGTRISSYLVHFDPIITSPSQTSSGHVELVGLQFLGVQLKASTLLAGDAQIGVPGVTYDSSEARGLESGQDTLTLNSDFTRLDTTFTVDSGIDEIRVIILRPPVPEPAAITLIGLVIPVLVRRYRRP